MDKIFTLSIKRILVLLVFCIIQVKTWAIETGTTTIVNKSNGIFSQPWIWIAVIVIAIIVLTGPFNSNKEYPVIMKKKNINKKDKI